MKATTAPNSDLKIGFIDRCQICGSKDYQDIINMGFTAPCDSLLTKAQLSEPEVSYPLNLLRCRSCGLVQIDHVVDPEKLFHPDYPYLSGITETLKSNLYGTSAKVAETIGLTKGSLVIDVGSNDGSILQGFKNVGMRVLGIEPTKIAEVANTNGIPTLQEFFSLDLATRIVAEHGHATVVTAANVFAHINQLTQLLTGIHNLLSEDGVFVSESHYMVDILKTLQYDSIYHEHLRFYLIRPLQTLFDIHGFTLEHAERIPNYGGSIRVYARKGRGRNSTKAVSELIELEEQMGCYDDAVYVDFARRTQEARANLRSMLVKLFDEGKRVVGIGCPGRAITLLTYCGISTDLLPYIAEQSTSLKLGLFTPSTHIPVIDEAVMLEEQPEYALILSWHYAKPIIKNLRDRGLKSKIIVPLPELQIVEP